MEETKTVKKRVRASAKTETPIPIDRGDPTDAPTTLDFEESPAPIIEKNSFDRAWDSVKEGLGISTETNKGKTPAPRPLSGKLNAKQQRFVDAATPTLALGFMTVATAVWSKIGPE